MSYNYRCTRKVCRRRYALRKHPWQYAREKRCSCGGRLSLDPAIKRQRKRLLCRCDGAPWPHRKGGVPSCIHSDADPRDALRWLRDLKGMR